MLLTKLDLLMKSLSNWASQRFSNILIKFRIFCQGCELWGAKPSWYSLNATHMICLHGFEHSLGFRGFRFTWPCLIADLSTRAKCLEPFGNCSPPSSVTQKVLFVVSVALWPSLYSYRKHPQICLQNSHGMNQCTMCQRTNYLNTTNHNERLPQLEQDIHTTKKHVLKYCKIFDST